MERVYFAFCNSLEVRSSLTFIAREHSTYGSATGQVPGSSIKHYYLHICALFILLYFYRRLKLYYMFNHSIIYIVCRCSRNLKYIFSYYFTYSRDHLFYIPTYLYYLILTKYYILTLPSPKHLCTILKNKLYIPDIQGRI